MRWTRVAVLLVFAVVLGALAPRARVGWLAARLLWEIEHPARPSSFAELRSVPVVEVVEFAAGDTVGVADVYRRVGRGAGPAVLLVPPAEDPAGRGQRVAEFADALARVGFTVLVPDLRLVGQPPAPDSVGVATAAFEHLAALPGVRGSVIRIAWRGASGGLAERYAAAWDVVSAGFLPAAGRAP